MNTCEKDCSFDREQKMLTVAPGVFCDPCIAPLVKALNDAGMRTVASCCGHGHQPPNVVLADGRWVMVLDRDTALAVTRQFPDINGDRC